MKETGNNKTTDFGYKEIPVEEKAEHVANVFQTMESIELVAESCGDGITHFRFKRFD